MVARRKETKREQEKVRSWSCPYPVCRLLFLGNRHTPRAYRCVPCNWHPLHLLLLPLSTTLSLFFSYNLLTTNFSFNSSLFLTLSPLESVQRPSPSTSSSWRLLSHSQEQFNFIRLSWLSYFEDVELSGSPDGSYEWEAGAIAVG